VLIFFKWQNAQNNLNALSYLDKEKMLFM